VGNQRVVVTSVVWIVAGVSFLLGVSRGTYLGLYGLLLAVGMSFAIFIGAALATRWIWKSNASVEPPDRVHSDA